MAINFDNALGIHQHTLGIRAKRAEVISSNIANANTPHYKARDVDFASAMQAAQTKQTNFSLNRSNERHFDISTQTQAHLGFRVPTQPDTGDGNTVDVQQEQTAFMENALEYQMSLGFLDSKFSGLRKAIRGE